jgi:hypothetical protein
VDIGDDAISENSPVTKFVRECLGVASFSFKGDSDWTLIIKLHGYIEASLNFLLVQHFDDSRLEEIISNLDVGDTHRGKLAFVKALNLLPKEERSFIRKLSELRNNLVHNIKNLNFNFPRHLENLDREQSNALKGTIIPILTGFVENQTEESARNMFDKQPRTSLLVCVIAIMMRVYGHHLERATPTSTREETIPEEP